MNKDILTLYDINNQIKEYKLLLVINNSYKYIIYTDKNNLNIKQNIYVIKVRELNNNEETLPISDEEWTIIQNEYQKIIK